MYLERNSKNGMPFAISLFAARSVIIFCPNSIHLRIFVQYSKTKILIVEDDAESREMLKVLLEARGYTLLCAGDGGEGFHLAVKQQPDLIITDLAMPEVDGFDLIRLLRQEPVTSAIPVIVFTAYIDIEQKALKKLGANEIAFKPIRVEQLLAMITQLLPVR